MTGTGIQFSDFGGFTQQGGIAPSAADGAQSLGFDGMPAHGASETASSFPGFGGTRATSSMASPRLSAWPHDQTLAMAVSLELPGELTSRRPAYLPDHTLFRVAYTSGV